MAKQVILTEPLHIPITGELAGTTTIEQMPDITCRMVMFKAHADNVGNVYIGASTVTVADGITDTTTGFQMDAGDSSPWLLVPNMNKLYRICDNAGDDLTYMALLD
jgi:hypothetical protein